MVNIPYNLTMRVRSVELREIRLPLRFPYETSLGKTSERRIILARLTGTDGFPLWCGGMLESAVGRAHNVALATLEGLSLPADLSASDRYWEEDIIHPLITVSSRGTVTASPEPGLGHEIDLDIVDRVTVRMEMVKS